MEKDDEIKGSGNSVNYKYRMHDPRIGRFFAVDPLTSEYPHNSPYAFSENSVIAFVELEGLERIYAADGSFLIQIGDNTTILVVTAKELSTVNYIQHMYVLNPSIIGSNAGLTEFSNVRDEGIQDKILTDIYSNDLGFDLSSESGVDIVINPSYSSHGYPFYNLAECDCYASVTNILVDANNNYLDNYNNVSLLLVKENTHINDYNKYSSLRMREYTGYINAFEHKELFRSATQSFQVLFAQNAAQIIWDQWYQESLLNKESNPELSRSQMEKANQQLSVLKSLGIEIDYTNHINIFENYGVNPDKAKKIGVTIDSQTLTNGN